MRIVDLNILLYAVNSDAARHAAARAWWEEALNDDEPVGLAWVVLLGFLRIVTSGRVFPRPLSPEAAMTKVESWLSLENVHIVHEKDDHWDTLKSLLHGAGTAGNLTTDTHLAALAISHDAVLVSCDADFARFKGLRRQNPLG